MSTASIDSAELFRRYESARHRPWQVPVLESFQSFLLPRSILTTTPSDIERWRSCNARWTRRTGQAYRCFIRGFLRWACEDGLIPQNPLETRNRAHRAAAWERILAGPVVDDAASTLDDLIICYLSKRLHRGDLAPKTARAYLHIFQDFAAFYGDRPVREINGDHVDDWLRSNGRKGALSRNTDLGRIKPFLTWMARRGHLAVDPRPDLPSLKVPRKLPPYLHGAEVAAVLRACTNRRDRLIILFMVQLALRCCEISTMRLEDISFTERYVKVTGKFGHQRLLPIDDQTWSAFGDYMGENPASGGPVIRALHHADRSIGAVNISQLVVQLMYAAKIKQKAHDGMSAHALRHTACVDMLRAGSHVRDVQAALGHVSLATTQSYMPMVIQGLRRAMSGRYYGDDPGGLDRVGEPLQLTLPGIDGPDPEITTLLDGLGGAAGEYPEDTCPMEVPRQWHVRR